MSQGRVYLCYLALGFVALNIRGRVLKFPEQLLSLREKICCNFHELIARSEKR